MIEKFISPSCITGPRRKDEKGATATEYGLLVGLIALIIVVGVGLFGNASTPSSTALAAPSAAGTDAAQPDEGRPPRLGGRLSTI